MSDGNEPRPDAQSCPVPQDNKGFTRRSFLDWLLTGGLAACVIGFIASVNAQPVMVLRTPQGFRALSAICTHLGCIVGWDAQKRQIACPCHAGFFDTQGRVVSGPPPRPLAEMGITVVGGEVMVRST